MISPHSKGAGGAFPGVSRNPHALRQTPSEHTMNSTTKSLIKILVVLLISASMFLVPFDALGVPLNEIQVRVVALFVMAALMWILEPIPIWATSALVIALSLLCASNKSISGIKPDCYNAQAVYSIIDDACAGADAEAVTALKKDVKSRLDKKA